MIPIVELRESYKAGTFIRDLIRKNLETTKIIIAQLDPNGLCNARCWYCPVKYEENPPEFNTNLSPENLDLILQRIREASVVDQNRFSFMYTAHYNEVLLYRYFEMIPDIFRKHKFRTMVLTNGTPLSPAKTDFIMANTDVFCDICLNVPGIEQEDWALKSGFNPKIHSILLRNLDYLHQQTRIPVTMLVNTITEYWKGDLKSNGIFTPESVAKKIVADMKARYPKFTVHIADALVDRSGLLDKHDVIKNERAVMLPNQKVIGCDHDAQNGSRIYGWLHINSVGDLFLCCDDYKMEYKFGNILEKSLDEIWLSDEHVSVIERGFNELCRPCAHHFTT